MMVNPLHPKLPSVALSLQGTCNRFNAADVQGQWDRVRVLWNKHLRHVLGPLCGFGSDGDERRFTIQKQLMSASAPGRRFVASWRGFVYTGRIDENGGVVDMHSQDSFHNSKKMELAIAVASRDFANGSHLATWWHIELVGDVLLFTPKEHGLWQRDITRKDPMSMKTVERTVAKKVDACMSKLEGGMQQRASGDLLNLISPETTARLSEVPKPPEDTLGTRMWLGVIRRFLRIFFSTKDSLETRYENCARVASFLRIKRHWIDNDDAYTLTKNAESRQCFEHVILQVESAALKIEA